MSLNIKNEVTHEKVRRLARLTGMSQTAAVDDAVERRLHEVETHPWGARGAVLEERQKRLREIFTPEIVEESRRIEAELFDEDGQWQ